MALRCGLGFALGATVLVLLSITGDSFHFKGFHPRGFPSKRFPPKPEVAGANFTVGGSDHWRFGFNYSDWSSKSAPFYLGDSLVFQYDPPSGSAQHSVYLMRDYKSFQACDFTGAEQVANVSQGGGEGFKFVLQEFGPHYFACGEHNGIHCTLGLMKFPVYPFPFKRCHG